MNENKKKRCVIVLAGLCCIALFGGCASGKNASSSQKEASEDMQMEAEAGKGTYKPSELVIQRQDQYEYPYMGLNFSLPESLLQRMDKKEAAMINLEGANEDETALSYALINWKSMTKEQRDMEVESQENAFYDWADSLTAIGSIGVYGEDALKDMDKLTGCTEHKEIGKSKDGAYTYYLSVNPKADGTLQQEINSISYEITDMLSLEEALASEDQQEMGNLEAEKGTVGEFSMQDVEGKAYTQEMFADYDLTMVNVFTTWCSPCVNEIPDLQKLHEEMSDQGVNVVGIVLDGIDGSGSTDEEILEKAKILAERTGAKYPFLVPDPGYMNGRLFGINAVPETFFVDKEGNIVGETYSGSHSLEEWKSIVETELKGVTK